MLVALVMGPLVYRRWFSREKIDERFVLAIVRNALQAINPKRVGRSGV